MNTTLKQRKKAKTRSNIAVTYVVQSLEKRERKLMSAVEKTRSIVINNGCSRAQQKKKLESSYIHCH